MLQVTAKGLHKFVKVIFWIFGLLFILNAIVVAVGYIKGYDWQRGVIDLFYFESKYNFPVFFSTFCLIAAAALLYGIYKFNKQNHLRDSHYWLVLAIGFLYLSIDESLFLHGKITGGLRTLFNAGGFFYYSWVIPAIVVCIILAIYFLPFWVRLPTRFKKLFGLSALLFVGGAVVLEVIAARYAPNLGELTLRVAIAGTVKQSIEWFGEIVFLYSLSEYIQTNMLTAPARDTLEQVTRGESVPESVSTYQPTAKTSYNAMHSSGKKD